MKISIIMCAKNSMPYIMASIESFRKQSYKHKELIVVNSLSDDNTIEYLNTIKDKNIKIYKYEGNIYASMNYGISKSSGKVVGILHSDDVYFNFNILSNVIKNFKNKDIDLIYGDILYSKKNDLTVYKRSWSNIQIKNKYDLPPHTGTFIRKSILDKNKYNTNFLISSDTDLLLRILNKKIKIYYIKKYICIMRMGGLSTNLNFLIRKIKEDLKIYYKNRLTIINYIQKIISKSNQFFFEKKILPNSYHKNLNEVAKVKFLDLNIFQKYKGNIFSALNLAFISYDYKYKIRSHRYIFWPDGVFSRIIIDKKKIPGREIFIKILNKLNYSKKNKKIIILGNLPKVSKKWLEKNLVKKYRHYSLPYDNAQKIYYKIRLKKLINNSIIILTLPTPKQELLANLIIKDYPECNILCIGGSINMLSGYEKRAPNFFYKFNLEWLWRLRFDTKRRMLRLIESLKLVIELYLMGKNKIH